MSRREILKSAGALAAISTLGFGRPAFAADPTMTTVCKIVGVPYFSLLETGLVAAGKKTGIRSNMIGPAQVDPAQQVRLIEDVIAKKVDVLGLIPLDVKVLAPVVQREQPREDSAEETRNSAAEGENGQVTRPISPAI